MTAGGPEVAPGASPPADRPSRSGLLRGRAYVPLGVLMVLSVVMATVGLASTRGWVGTSSDSDIDGQPEGSLVNFAADAPITEPACRSGVAPGDASVWSGDGRSSAEQEYIARTSALTVPAIEGQEGFVFWADVQANGFSQALGRITWTQAEREAWLAYISSLDSALDGVGADLIVLVAPSVETIYPEMLPTWAQPLRGLTSMDQLVGSAGDLPVVDVRVALVSASADSWVYSAVNSHWTPFGAHAAWQKITPCLQALHPDRGYDAIEVSEVASVQHVDPPNEFTEWGFPAPRVDWTVPDLEPAPVTASRTSMAGATTDLTWPAGLDILELPVTTTGGLVDRPVLVAGDSQGTALSAFWAQSFGSVTHIRHYLDVMEKRPDIFDAAQEVGAELVVLELTERYLGYAAPAVIE